MALTIKRPWAGAVLLCEKDVENRTWKTDYRGTLAVHAGKGVDGRAVFPPLSSGWFLGPGGNRLATPLDEHAGAVLGLVELVGCVPCEECASPWMQWNENGWCWMLEKPRVFVEPVPLVGRLGLFGVEDSLLERETVEPVAWWVEHAPKSAARRFAGDVGDVRKHGSLD